VTIVEQSPDLVADLTGDLVCHVKRQPLRTALVAAGTCVLVGAGVWMGVAATTGGGHSHAAAAPAAAAPTAAGSGMPTEDHAAHRGLVAPAPPPAPLAAPIAPAAAAAVAEPAGSVAVEAAPVVNGYRLQVSEAPDAVGEPGQLRFTVVDADGVPLPDFLVSHERSMHLIVARSDTAHFQHLHPERDLTGEWVQEMTLPEEGRYRLFADFVAATGGDGTPVTAVVDVVAGDPIAEPLPPSSNEAEVGQYRVVVEGTGVAGQDRPLTFTITRDGAPVTDVQPYLGALGHLVVLRASDLAYVHAHPTASEGFGPVVPFGVLFPSAGDYRMFLQFQHEGQVHTAEFTVVV